jgi:predicted HTH transcriptional regulator
MTTENKGFHEEFSRFFEEPSREGLRDLLQRNYGEFDFLDFKREWLAYPKLARHLLGLANSGGGCLVFGVAEKDDKSLDPVGLAAFEDKANVQKGIQKFLPSQLEYQMVDFGPYEASEYPVIEGKKFQVVFVLDDPRHIPFVAEDNGDGIRKAAIYVRRGTSTEEATYDELQNVLNRRLATGYSSQRETDIERHLAELRVLYRHVGGILAFAKLVSPFDDFTTFVVRMIEIKKGIIRDLLSMP